MKNIFTVLIAAFVFVLTIAPCKSQKKGENKKMELTTESKKVSYALGMQIGNNLTTQGLDTLLEMDYLISGIKDQLNQKAQLDINATDEILNKFFSELQKGQWTEKIEQGEKFLAENASRNGIISTPSGLQYEILVEGNGPKPSISSTVNTHYKGTLLDGTVFDSSYERGEPISFPLNGVITGWTEALQLMPVGSKWKLYLPYNLAYGERGSGAAIGPYETLIFEVELLGIE